MKTRRVNCHLYREGNELRLRFITIHEYNPSPLTAIAEQFRYDHVQENVANAFATLDHAPVGMHLPANAADFGVYNLTGLRQYIRDTIGDRTYDEYQEALTQQLLNLTHQSYGVKTHLVRHYEKFNRMSHKEAVAHLRLIYRTDNYTPEIKSTSYPPRSHWVHDFTLALPSDLVELQRLIGCLDTTLHADDIEGPRHGWKPSVYHFNTLPDSNNHSDIVYEAVNSNTAPEAEQELSRFVACYIVEQYQKNTKDLAAYKEAVSNLQAILATEDASLTKQLKQTLFPRPSIDEYLNEKCKDPVIRSMLNPKISHVEAAQAAIVWLRQELATGVFDEKAIIAPLDKYQSEIRFLLKTNRPRREDKSEALLTTREYTAYLHKEIRNWFFELNKHKIKLWHDLIGELEGKQRQDGSFYDNNSAYELDVVSECRTRLNQSGLMELVISDERPSSYECFYGAGTRNHNNFEQDLRFAFHLLGLHFLPGIDFHNEPILFDVESSKELMNRGMHFSIDYFKKLMRASHHHRLFQPNTKGETQPIQTLPRDPKNIISYWTHPNIDREEEIAVRQIKIT